MHFIWKLVRNLYHIHLCAENLKVQKLYNSKQVDGTCAATEKQRQIAQEEGTYQAGEEGERRKTATITVRHRFQATHKKITNHMQG